MQELHEGHPGVTRMKMLARSYIWWPNMDSELENKVKTCHECQVNRHVPAKAPLHPWEWPEEPWSRVHIDYAGPLHGEMFLVCVDAHSKYMEVQVVNSATSAKQLTNCARSLLHMEFQIQLLATMGLRSPVRNSRVSLREMEYAILESHRINQVLMV
ncbi:Uncharacterized protein K02A2.6 [Mytilus coruscus]|uniref:Uncharacterized protein K02A2.6 n=1 Tax=Mytilus coruscus TaxID=42192 RepID=A0A6J8D1D8_MYTCO|nr:Uncharacterized protein K02A2.6 [Mytilus coruscus]